MKAITLWQPWASLVAVGTKTIETRSWATGYRGPIAIHAAAGWRGFDLLPGDCEGNYEGGWQYGYIGDYQVGVCRRSSGEGRRGDSFIVRLEGGPLDGTLPFGAFVATAHLVAVVPIVGPAGLHPYPRVIRDGDHLEFRGYGEADGIDHELPYGDYTPGRYAWILARIRTLPEPIPAAGRQKLWDPTLEQLERLQPAFNAVAS